MNTTPRKQPTALIDGIPPQVLVFTWDDRAIFAAIMLTLGGSTDVHGGRLTTSDPESAEHLGRYARTYSLGSAGAPGWPDAPGRTVSFLAWPRLPRPDGISGPIALAGVPWGCAAEYEAAYQWLAAVAGCLPNDALRDKALHAIAIDVRARAECLHALVEPQPGWEERAVVHARTAGLFD